MSGGAIQHKLRREGGLIVRLPVPVALIAILCFGLVPPSALALPVSEAELKCHNELGISVPRTEIKRHAQALRSASPSSFVAEYVLGSLEAEDANWPDAIRRLKAARVLVECAPGHATSDKPGELPWRPLILNALADALDNMDRNKEAQSVWAELAALHLKAGIIPDFGPQRISSLLKLGRIDEALQLAKIRLSELGLTDVEAIARRSDMARVQFALEPDGRKAYESFAGIVQDAVQVRGATVPRTDLAFHARRQGEYRVAMDVLKQSASVQNPASASHPYCTLSDMDIAACRWDSARTEIRMAWNWLQGKKRNVRYELLADTRIRAAQFYLAAGYPDRAERLAIQYVARPIRSGFSTRPIEQWEAGVNLLCWTASRQVREIESAAVVDRQWYARLWVRFCHIPRLWQEALMARHVRTLVAEQLSSGLPLRDALVLVDAPIWLWGDLCQVLGSKRVSALFARFPIQGAQKRLFLDAMQSDLAFAAGRWNDASVVGQKALLVLPEDENLLRARICAIIGESLRKQGDPQSAVSWFAKAYRANPAIFRILGLKIPVAGDSDNATRSPFFRRLDGGFKLALNQELGELSYSLDSSVSGLLASGKIQFSSAADEQSKLFRLHRMFFSPVGLLKDCDYAALEGQAIAGPVEKTGR